MLKSSVIPSSTVAMEPTSSKSLVMRCWLRESLSILLFLSGLLKCSIFCGVRSLKVLRVPWWSKMQ